MSQHHEQSTRLLLLDRDGIINVDKGYVGSKADFELMPGIIEVITEFANQGFLPVVVTNQSGIARGYYSEQDFAELTRWMQQLFSRYGLPHVPVYYCPHHPEKGQGEYRQPCHCRKPEPGMLRRAAHDLQADLSRSVMVGDSWRDMQAGARAGVKVLCYVSSEAAPETDETRYCKVYQEASVAQLLPLCQQIIERLKTG